MESQAACLLLFISPFILLATHSNRVMVAVATEETLLHLILPSALFYAAHRDSLGNLIWPM